MDFNDIDNSVIGFARIGSHHKFITDFACHALSTNDHLTVLREIYRELWGDPRGARLVELAIFCDSDQTGTESLAYFSDVRVVRN